MMFSTGTVLPSVTGSKDALLAFTSLGLGGSAALGPWTCENLSLVLLLLPAANAIATTLLIPQVSQLSQGHTD